MKTKRILITGGSDGIGWHLVQQYRAAGWEVAATGRRPRAKIQPALPISVRYIQQDLTAPDAAERLTTALGWDRLDLLIQNAGIGLYGAPADQSPADIAQMITVNVTTPLLIARALFAPLSAASGQVIFIGSIAYRRAHKDFAAYAATKSALDGAARSLRLEWSGKIKVQVQHPGPTATGMHGKVGMPASGVQKLFTPPQVVARVIMQAANQSRWRIRFGLGFMLRQALLARWSA